MDVNAYRAGGHAARSVPRSTSFRNSARTAGTLTACSRPNRVPRSAPSPPRPASRWPPCPRSSTTGTTSPRRPGSGYAGCSSSTTTAGRAAAAAGPARSAWSCGRSTASGRSRSSAGSPAPTSTSWSRPCPPAPPPRPGPRTSAASGRAGVIVVTSQFTSAQKRVFQRAGIPCVVIDPVDLPDPDVPSVGATNWGGGLAATRHLTQLGHRRIAVIGGPAGVLCGRARIDGYRAALDAAGLPFDPELVREGTFRHAGGYDAASALLRPARPADRRVRRQRRAGVRGDRGGPGGRAGGPARPRPWSASTTCRSPAGRRRR